MMKADRRTVEERRNWMARFNYVNAVLKHVEQKGSTNVDIETLAETLDLPMCIVNRIFSEIRNDYAHRFPWLKEDDGLEDIVIPERNKK